MQNSNSWTPPQRRLSQRQPGDAEPKAVVESPLGIMLRAVYERERSRYDTMRAGRQVDYVAPRFYKTRVAARYDDDDGSGDVVAKGRVSTWEKLAEFLLREKIDPELFLRVQFQPETLKLSNPPEPSQLMTPDCMQAYDRALSGMDNLVAVSLITQQEIASSEVGFICAGGRSTADAIEQVIMDENLELSPLFRFCLARSMTGERFQYLARYYQTPAVLQYVCCAAAFNASWHQYLPMGFAGMADRLYKFYLNKYTTRV
jgi:hypothetical protein